MESFFGDFANHYTRPEDASSRILGVLAVEKQESAGFVLGFGMRIMISEGGMIKEYLYYGLFNTKYIVCRGNGTEKGAVPEYQVCREVLSMKERRISFSITAWGVQMWGI